MSIPNIIHFVFFGFTDFNIIHFLSVISAHHIHKPEQIFIYNEKEPQNNIFWNYLKSFPNISIVPVIAPTEFNGIPLHSFQYKADIFRLQTLIEKGGIYLDIDVLSLKSIQPLLNTSETKKECILGVEGGNDYLPYQIENTGSITNAALITKPQQDYIKFWLEETGKNLVGKEWAFHAVCLPRLILVQHPDYLKNIEILPKSAFMPFCFRDPFIFDSQQNDRLESLKDSYTMHLWETIWNRDYLDKINLRYFFDNNNILTQLFQKYILEIPSNPILLKITQEFYYQHNFQAIYNLALEKFNKSTLSTVLQNELLFYHAYACHQLFKLPEAKSTYQIILDQPAENSHSHLYCFSECNIKLIH